jgi:outer membrane protein assembly factor BamB
MGSSRWRILKLSSGLWSLTVLAPALVGPTVAQAEWPQWRGAARDGSVSRPASRRPWLAAPIKLWERTVGGGYSGPVVADDRIWVHSRSRAQEVVTCLTLGEGEPVWSARYDADFEQDPTALVHGSGPYSTPSIVDGRRSRLGGITGAEPDRPAVAARVQDP